MSSASVFRVCVAVAAVGVSLALLLPAQAQFWGDWGGRPQRQQQYNNNWNNNWFGGGWNDRRNYDPYRQEREAPVDYSRAPVIAEEARGHDPDRGDGRCQRGLAGLRARRCLFREPGVRHRAQASHGFRPDPLRSTPRS